MRGPCIIRRLAQTVFHSARNILTRRSSRGPRRATETAERRFARRPTGFGRPSPSDDDICPTDIVADLPLAASVALCGPRLLLRVKFFLADAIRSGAADCGHRRSDISCAQPQCAGNQNGRHEFAGLASWQAHAPVPSTKQIICAPAQQATPSPVGLSCRCRTLLSGTSTHA
jgi:hypothetical protein